jgi:diguanylate cyclase (GGDEF)-like protein
LPAHGFKTAATLTGLPLFFYAVFLLIRMIAVLFSPAEQSLLDENWIQILFFLLVFIFGSLWSSGFILMITQRLRYDLYQQARFDILTQRPNRLSMQERLETSIAQIRRSGQSFSVFIIDVDYFKQVNDAHGHDVGDFVLREVAKRLWKTLRPQDSLGRWGGEEFLAILPDTDAQTALVIAERLRVTCMSTPFLAGDANIKVTISTGVAVCSRQDADLHLLLRTADRALYRAKNSGRNCVHLAESSQSLKFSDKDNYGSAVTTTN